MKRILLISSILFISSVVQVSAQYRDILNGKELDKLNQLNPAFTGVLNQLRILSNKSEDVNLGFESRLFGGKNYIGANYYRENLENIERNGLKLAYVRDLKVTEHLQIKLAGGLSADNKFLKNTNGLMASYVEDFTGHIYFIDSLNVDKYDEKTKSIDLSVGTVVTFRNLIFGLSAKHLNTPNVSLKEGFVHNVPIELSAEFLGFFKLTPNFSLIPSSIYALQNGHFYSISGLGLRFKSVVVQSQYELYKNNAILDIGLSIRYKRYFVSMGYGQPISKSNIAQDVGQLRLAINTSLFKLKNEVGGINEQLKQIY